MRKGVLEYQLSDDLKSIMETRTGFSYAELTSMDSDEFIEKMKEHKSSASETNTSDHSSQNNRMVIPLSDSLLTAHGSHKAIG